MRMSIIISYMLLLLVENGKFFNVELYVVMWADNAWMNILKCRAVINIIEEDQKISVDLHKWYC